MTEQTAAQTITLGKISAPFGVRGWTKVSSFTNPPERLLEYPVWQLVTRGAVRHMPVADGRRHGRFIVVKFDGIDDRDEVALLTNSTVEVNAQTCRRLMPEIITGSI